MISGAATVDDNRVLHFSPTTSAGTVTLGIEVSDGTTSVPYDISVNIVNTAPAGQNDGYSTFAGESLIVGASAGVLANDLDDYKPNVVAVSSEVTVTTSQGGSATLRPDGGFEYIPPVGLTQGTDSFTYAPSDGYLSGGTTTRLLSAMRNLWPSTMCIR